MLEVNLARRTPVVVPLEATPAGPIAITLLPSAGRLVFRAKAHALAGKALVAGFAVDAPINKRVADGETASLRLGPDEWMFLCPDADVEDAAEAIARAMEGAAFSIVDVSHRDVSFEVKGRDADAVINAGCPIDLSDRAFPVGSATRTIFGKSDIVLARIGPSEWRVTAWRSFSAYVHGLLCDAAKDYSASH